LALLGSQRPTIDLLFQHLEVRLEAVLDVGG
jgi:hypothetical protein